VLPSEPAEPSDQGGSNAQRGDDPMLDQGRTSAYMSAPVPYCVIDPRKQIRREFLEPRVLLTGGKALSKA
jgi:hypothetical protein